MPNERDRIHSLGAIRDAITQRRSLVCPAAPCFDKPRPAAFLINLTGATLLRLIESGLYIYRKV